MSKARSQLLSSLPRLFLVLCLVAICWFPASDSPCLASAGLSQPLSIDIASLTSFLNTLSPDEKDEQLRDWALYGLKDALSLNNPEEMPVRHPALMATQPGEISPGRVFFISDKQWGILASPEVIDNKPLLGGLIDRKYATCNRAPEQVSVFSFKTDPLNKTITVVPAGSIGIHDLFSPAYGYFSSTVDTLAGLGTFLSRIDDLTGFTWQSGRLRLSGRKYRSSGARSLTIEDVAGLYQAYNPPVLPAALRERLVAERFAQLLRTDARLQKELGRGRIKKSQVLKQLRRELKPKSAEQVGFSLDPQLDYRGLAADLGRLTDRHGAGPLHGVDPEVVAVLNRYRGELKSALLRLEHRRDLRPLLTLRRSLEKSADRTELLLAATLQYLETSRSYQTARYDGNLQGTSAGMVLFYTDLLAKLWALDYRGLAPKSTIKGFRTMQEIAVPKMDWADYVRLSKTRLWFGLRSEGFDVYGDKLLFQPAVTRVYAASSDPMFPGKESSPNYQSKAFLGWWDRHYETVADVEPYYYKLDQIQKWGCLFMVLKEKRLTQLDFLQGVPVRRDLDFETWVKADPTLARVVIPFLDRQKYGRSTECLPLLQSSDYLLMTRHYVLSGGVSLASRKDILAKLHGSGRGTAPQRVDHRKGAAAGVPALSAAAPSRALKGGRHTAHDSVVAAGSPAVDKGEARGRRKARGGETAGGAGERSPMSGYGSFRAEKHADLVRLTWVKGPSLAQHDLVASLAALQQSDLKRNKGEEVFAALGDVRSVVRVKEGSAYLVKTGASGDRWIYLAMNPVDLAAFPAKASAASPEADIFCAKLVSEDFAKKLAAGKTVLK